MTNSLVNKCWVKSSRFRLIAACGIAAAVALTVPLQHYISLGRYQHYAIGLALFGLGYLLQATVGWKKISTWGQLSLVMTGTFFAGVACVFWTNPWLDWRVAVQTEGKEQFRSLLLMLYVVCATIISLTWLKWWADERRIRERDNKPKGDVP